MLREGDEASRRKQGKFVLAEELGKDVDRERLQTAIASIDKKASFPNAKQVAEMGPLLVQYINYQRLSDNAAHTSAASLHHHVTAFEGGGWKYRTGPGSPGEVQSTLHRAVLAILPVGVVVTQLVPDASGNLALQALGARFATLSAGTTI